MIEILIEISIYIYMYTKNKVQEMLSLGLSLPHKERDDMAHIILQKNIILQYYSTMDHFLNVFDLMDICIIKWVQEWSHRETGIQVMC